MTKYSHSECEHPRTKAARAACRRAREAAKPVIGYFVWENAHAMNAMWDTLNSRQESLIQRYEIVYATCEYCERPDVPCFRFEKIGYNVCGPCERMHDVHEYEEKI